MYRFVLAQTDSENVVYVNLISSPAGHYVSRQPHVIGLIRELLASIDLSGTRVVVERNMGRTIGNTDIVETSEKDTIYYAQPLKTEVYSRYAKHRYPQPSQTLTIVAVRDDVGDYEIQDTWVGAACPAFPGDEHATAASKAYWQTHALVPNVQVIQTKSITRECPY
ncbi:MAG TPA: hypothetical protein VGS08_05815 [Candidatus Saccharimonadales bacterium]|nr:hypothetical protein [Candidatus Saccharimonadales bacterium]